MTGARRKGNAKGLRYVKRIQSTFAWRELSSLGGQDEPLIEDRRLRRVKELTDLALPQYLSLQHAARAAGLEPHYFSGFFRRRVGETYCYWRRSRRIRHALALVRSGTKTLTAVAFAVGYRDLTSMERAFKRTLGKRPGVIRAFYAKAQRSRAQRSRRS